MMRHGRLVFNRNRPEGQYEAQSHDQMVIYVCVRVPREGWLPEVHHLNSVRRKVTHIVGLAQFPIPLNEAKCRCDADHHERIRKTGSADDVAYIEKWPLGDTA